MCVFLYVIFRLFFMYIVKYCKKKYMRKKSFIGGMFVYTWEKIYMENVHYMGMTLIF